MADAKVTLSATGNADLTGKPLTDQYDLVAVNGAFTGLQFTFQASYDGTNFFNCMCYDRSAGSVIVGGTTISPTDATPAAWTVPCDGFQTVRLNCSQLSTQTVIVNHHSYSTANPAVQISPVGATSIAGSQTFADGSNIILGTSTGTKIGTATTQKLGFYNATPVVQGLSTTDIRTELVNLGFLATGGANPLNTNGGALTVGSILGTGTVALTDNMTITDAKNIILNATTGTKIGTATTQKLGFFNASPVVQPVASSDTTTAAAGSVTNVFLNTTFNGTGGTAAYSIGGVVTALKALGLLAP